MIPAAARRVFWPHGFLVLLLLLAGANITLLGIYGRSDVGVGNLLVSLTLLMNHVAFQYSRAGVMGLVMKGAAVALLLATFRYFFNLM